MLALDKRLEDIVKAYCEIVRAAGFNMDYLLSAYEYGPEVAAVALKNWAGITMDELAKYSDILQIEEAPALPKDDPARIVVRIPVWLMRRFCR